MVQTDQLPSFTLANNMSVIDNFLTFMANSGIFLLKILKIELSNKIWKTLIKKIPLNLDLINKLTELNFEILPGESILAKWENYLSIIPNANKSKLLYIFHTLRRLIINEKTTYMIPLDFIDLFAQKKGLGFMVQEFCKINEKYEFDYTFMRVIKFLAESITKFLQMYFFRILLI